MSIDVLVNEISKEYEMMIGKEDKKEGWLLTTAQYNATPNHKALDGIEAIAKKYDYNIGVIMVKGAPYEKDENIHPRLQEHTIITGNMRLNDSLEVNNYQVKPQKIRPLTGIRRFVSKKGNRSAIFGSPKQSWEHMPSKKPNPRLIATTGAITKPRYNLNTESGIKAELMHQYGVLVIDILDDKFFNWSNIIMNKNGTFNNHPFGYWDGEKLHKAQPLAGLNMGDGHYMKASDVVHEWTKRIIKWTKPKVVADHDIAEMSCISHHNIGKSVSKYYARQGGLITLDKELKTISKYMTEIYKTLPKGAKYIVPQANHNEHLAQWINEGRYVDDPENLFLGVQGHYAMLQGFNPLEYLLKNYYKVPKRIKFLSRDEEYKVRGVEMSDHMDKGPNGSRFSFSNAIQNLGDSTGGHNHTAVSYEGVSTAGTRSIKRMGYNTGASSWSHSMEGIDQYGNKQIFNYVIRD